MTDPHFQLCPVCRFLRGVPRHLQVQLGILVAKRLGAKFSWHATENAAMDTPGFQLTNVGWMLAPCEVARADADAKMDQLADKCAAELGPTAEHLYIVDDAEQGMTLYA